MFEFIDDNFLVALIGLATGLLLGLAARLGRFCTMGAIEDALYGESWVRMRMWFLAIGVAVTGVYALTASGYFAPEQSFYLSIRWMPLASVLGGLMFDPKAEGRFRAVAYAIIACSALLGLPLWKG